MTLDELRVSADRAGLNLSDEDLKRLQTGIERTTGQATLSRKLLTPELEPASVFHARTAGAK